MKRSKPKSGQSTVLIPENVPEAEKPIGKLHFRINGGPWCPIDVVEQILPDQNSCSNPTTATNKFDNVE